MIGPEYKQLVKVDDVDGCQHGTDDYWYRPLILSENLFTYVAHVPPQGGMHAHADEGEFETSLYMLRGSLEIEYGEENFTMDADTALHVPSGVPLGVRNSGEGTASFVLTFYPPPDIQTMEQFWQDFADRDGTIKSAQLMNELVEGS